MQKCPNCGREALRTEDWACQWCGYPLLSGAYKKIPKTYKQLAEERLNKPKLAEPVSEPEPDSEPEDEAVPEDDPVTEQEDDWEQEPAQEQVSVMEPELESVAEIDPEPDLDMEPEPVTETEIQTSPEPEMVNVPEPEPETEHISLLELDEISDGMELTIEELSSVFKKDKVAADAKFQNKNIRLTGAVKRVVVNSALEIYYIIMTGVAKREMWDIRCTFDGKYRSELSRLRAGQPVMIQGTYNGHERNIIMKDCILVS